MPIVERQDQTRLPLVPVPCVEKPAQIAKCDIGKVVTLEVQLLLEVSVTASRRAVIVDGTDEPPSKSNLLRQQQCTTNSRPIHQTGQQKLLSDNARRDPIAANERLEHRIDER